MSFGCHNSKVFRLFNIQFSRRSFGVLMYRYVGDLIPESFVRFVTLVD